MRNLWALLILIQSGSVAWIKAYVLKDRSLWSVPLPSDCSWSKKIPKFRDYIRPYVQCILGDGK